MKNKVALVTGGGTGIGRGITIELAKAGYDVVINYYSSSEKAEKVVSEIEKLGVRSIAIQANLSNLDGINKLFDDFEKQFERLDLFVNNSGVTLKSPFLETTEEIFDSMCNLDYKGAYFCMQRAAKLMVNKNIQGNIIVISSNNAKAHFADVSVYGSVKAALTKLAEHIAIELAKYKIRVNTIAPGWTDTGASRLDEKGSTYYKVPLKRWCTPEEIGKAVLFLSGDNAFSITGITLVIDGGALLISDKAEKYGL